MKGLGKRFLSVALVVILAFATATTAFASSVGNTTTIKRTETVEGYNAVTADTKAEFKLSVKRAEDTFKMYQLTELTWTESNGVNNLTIDWVPELKTWLADAGNGFSDASYASPIALGEREDVNSDGVYEDETAVISLLRAIREDDELMAVLDANYVVGYHDGPDYASGNSQNSIDPKVATVTPDTTLVNDTTAFQNSYTVTDMPTGLCFIAAEGSGRTYQPVLLNLIPVQVGPTGNWYVKKAQEYTLKYESVGINKTINGAKHDVVRNGEIVDFRIEIDVPVYLSDGNGSYLESLFNVYDDMAQGFELISTTETLKYVDKDGKENHPATSVSSDAVGNVTVSDTTNTYNLNMMTTANVYYCSTDDSDVFYATPISGSTQYTFWGIINGAFVKLGNYADTSATYTTLISSYNGQVSASDRLTCTAAEIAKRDYTKSFISCSFNYDNLMKTLQDESSNLFVPDKIVIEYKAIVNEDSYVGTDENTNDVYVYYKGDSAGNIEISQDEVVAWTYAANIVKVDGSTYQTTKTGDDADGNPIYADPTYLEGAKFNLYRLDTTYCGGNSYGTEGATITETDYPDFTWISDADDNASYSAAREAWLGTDANNYEDGLIYLAIQNHYANDDTVADKATAISTAINEAVAATQAYDTLDAFENKYAASNGTEYFKEYITTAVTSGMSYYYLPVWVDSCDNCATPHYHMQAYSLFKEGVESTATAEGVNIVGLDPNTYLLVETSAPAGYNELSEGIQFSINQYTDAQAEAAGNSYKGFINDVIDENGDGENIEDGIYDILVKNYKGLVLPSTGGMGTLIFTIIGLTVMGAVLIVIIVKSRRKQEANIY